MRKIGAVVFGVIIAIALIVVVEMLGHSVFPPPPGVDFKNPEAVRAMLAEAPAGALLIVILAYVIATFGGGLLAALVARETPMKYALIVGGFVLLGTAANLVMVSHPTWFIIAAPAAIAATVRLTGRLADKLVSRRPAQGQ